MDTNQALIILFIQAVGCVAAWYFTKEHYKEINKQSKEANAILDRVNKELDFSKGLLEDKLFNIGETKQIYDQLRGLIPRKKAPGKRKR